MGAGSIEDAIADSGPLIHLSEIGALALLRVFGALHIPDAIWSETVGQNRVSSTAIQELGLIERHTVSPFQVAQFVKENMLDSLHSGERESLCLCRQIGTSTLLTDDMAVREAAKRLGLTPVGSLGIIVRAYRLGHITLDDAERYLAALYDTSSLFVTRAIVELAMEQLHQLKNG